MNTKDLLLEDGSYISWFKKKPDNFINKTIVIYGKRKSGKSVIVDEIMHICKSNIVFIYVIAKSVTANNPYLGKVPTNCIKSDVTKEWLEDFLKIQQNRASIYNTANDIKNLTSVFNRIKTNNLILLEERIKSEAALYINRIKTNTELNYGKIKEDIAKIQKIKSKQLIELYKINIRLYKSKLLTMIDNKELAKEEICVVKYLDFKPHVMLIFDDCASKFKEWCKSSTIIKEMFYEGRHYYITLVITTQSDKEVVSELRQNTSISIFTTNQAAICSFSRQSDAYPKYIKKRAEICVNRIFTNETSNGINYKKLIYDNDADDPFFYTIADIYDDFQIGCKALWDLDKKLEEQKNQIDCTTEFFDRYYDL
jgi:hypothetical protein